MVMFTLSYVTLTVKEFSIAVSVATTSLFYCYSGTNTLTLDSMNIYGVIVVFVTDLFLAIIYQAKLHCHDSFY